MQDYSKLDVWQKAHAFVLDVYAVTSKFPVAERYGLAIQLRRSAASVPCNLAEGCGRGADTMFATFLDVASGSANEAEYQLRLARDLGYVTPERHQSLQKQLAEVGRMLTGLRRTVRRRIATRDNPTNQRRMRRVVVPSSSA